MTIKAQGEGTTAIEHIHNVVAEREYQRGYDQAKEEYDRKLAEIKSRIKDYYYNKGYQNGLRDAYDWHPLTKESRPPKGGEYLVDFQGMKVGICQYINGHFRNYGEIFDGMITRWTYLPLSEREEKEMENADGQGQVSG
jgi:hypothetical protein